MKNSLENKEMSEQRIMEEMPVGQLLWKMAGPSVLGVMAYNLYNIFDTIFVSQGTGTRGIGGIAVAFPLFILLSAVSSTLGSGAASVISRALGEKDRERAAKTAANTFALFYAVALMITIWGLVWLDELLALMSVTPDLLPYARSYTRIILLGAVTSTGFSNLIRAEGSSRYAMLQWVIPMGANIVLDSLFIFVFHMGVAGAAAGTVLGQSISMFMFIYYFFISGKSVLHIRLRHFLPDLGLIREIISIGLPSFLQLAGQAAALMVVNRLLKTYGGDLAISVYGIVNRIVVFFTFPVQGLSQGLSPVIGYNYGAGQIARVKAAVKTACRMAGGYGLGAFIITFVGAEFMIRIFTGEAETVEMGSHVLRIVTGAVVFSGIQMMVTSFFQAEGQKAVSLFLALLGQFFVLAPTLFLLSWIFGLDGLWYAFPVSAFGAMAVSAKILDAWLKR